MKAVEDDFAEQTLQVDTSGGKAAKAHVISLGVILYIITGGNKSSEKTSDAK